MQSFVHSFFSTNNIIVVVIIVNIIIIIITNNNINADASQTIHLRYQIKEEVPTGYFIGNVAKDAFKDGDDLHHVSNFRFKFLTTPTVRIQIDEMNGDVRVSGRIDREALCGRGVEMDVARHLREGLKVKGMNENHHHHHEGEGSYHPIEVCRVRQDVAVHPIYYFRIIKILLEIEDVNDNNPEFRPSTLIQELPESSLVNSSSLNIPSATDVDLNFNSIVRYELIDEDGICKLNIGRKLDGSSDIKLLLIKRLDREKTKEHKLKVIAYDGGQHVRSGSIDITIIVLDANDNQPEFELKSYETTVQENLPIGTTILRVTAHDPDSGMNGQVSYALSPSSQSAYGDVFAVNDLTGDVFIRGPVDYERTPVYRLLISAIDGGTDPTPSEATVVIRVNDSNDNSPHIVVNSFVSSDASVADVQENSAAGTFVCHVIVTDPDSDESGRFTCQLNSRKDHSSYHDTNERSEYPNPNIEYFNSFQYSAKYKRHLEYNDYNDESTEDEHFKLIQLLPNEYHVLSGRIFDRETECRFLVSIVCRDNGIPSLTSVKEIIVNVLDMNDNPPIFERHTYRAELFENNYVGVHIVQVTATDMDSKNNSQPEYWLEDPTKSFQIQSNGLITASAALDRERHREHHFTVFAKDQGHPPLTSSSQISVKVLDVNDELPKFPRNQFRFEVLENQPVEVEVGTLEASDLDGPTFNEFKFSFFHPDDPASENFKLDPTNGRISTLKSFDREEQKSYRFLVSVVDIQNNILFSTATVSVKIGDLNDQTPTFTFPTSDNHTIRLPTRAKKNHPVTKISAFDFDEGPNGTIVYEIVKGNELEIFSLESTTGNLFVSQDRNDESPLSNHSSFSLVLCARDGGPKSLKNFTFLNILLVDQWFTMGGSDDNDDAGLDYDGWFINFASHQSKRVAVWMVTGVSVVVVLFLLITIATVLWKQRSNGKSFKQPKKKLNSPKENGSINKFNNDINNADINAASKNAALYKQQQINKMFANNDSNTSVQKILNNSNCKIVSSTPEIIKKIDLTNITESIIPANPVNHAAVDTTKTLELRWPIAFRHVIPDQSAGTG